MNLENQIPCSEGKDETQNKKVTWRWQYITTQVTDQNQCSRSTILQIQKRKEHIIQ